jgi:hypothetical protein
MTDYYKKRSSADLIITEGTSSRNGFGYAQIAGIFKQFQVSTGTKQSRRNIKRWKDNCSTDRVRKNKSSLNMSREARYSPLPLKLTDRCKLQSYKI